MYPPDRTSGTYSQSRVEYMLAKSMEILSTGLINDIRTKGFK